MRHGRTRAISVTRRSAAAVVLEPYSLYRLYSASQAPQRHAGAVTWLQATWLVEVRSPVYSSGVLPYHDCRSSKAACQHSRASTAGTLSRAAVSVMRDQACLDPRIRRDQACLDPRIQISRDPIVVYRYGTLTVPKVPVHVLLLRSGTC